MSPCLYLLLAMLTLSYCFRQANFTAEAADFRERNRNALSTAISSVLAYKEDMITQTTVLLDLALSAS